MRFRKAARNGEAVGRQAFAERQRVSVEEEVGRRAGW